MDIFSPVMLLKPQNTTTSLLFSKNSTGSKYDITETMNAKIDRLTHRHKNRFLLDQLLKTVYYFILISWLSKSKSGLQLRQLLAVARYLTPTANATLIHSFVLSHPGLTIVSVSTLASRIPAVIRGSQRR